MHVQLRRKGRIDFGAELREEMPPTADIVFLSAHDSDLRQMAAASHMLDRYGRTLALCNYLTLANPQSLPHFIERTLSGAQVIVLRMIGGASYWPDGVDQLIRFARAERRHLLCLPGGTQWDDDFASRSTAGMADVRRTWRYLAEGGSANAEAALLSLIRLLGEDIAFPDPAPMPVAGFLTPDDARPADILLVIYRALAQAGDTEPVDAFREAALRSRLRLSALYVTSLKDPVCRGIVQTALAGTGASIILNATAFASDSSFLFGNRPVLQIAFAGMSRHDWAKSARGLSFSDLAMHVVMPEIDGRLFIGPAAFKVEPAQEGSGRQSYALLQSEPRQIDIVIRRAAAWNRLRGTDRSARRVAVLLANYPSRDGRLGNGVGLDTPASVALAVRRLRSAGYVTSGAPEESGELMRLLVGGTTNDATKADASSSIAWSVNDYCSALSCLSSRVRDSVVARWGKPEDDPHIRDGAMQLALHWFGNLVIGIQPARGYEIDPATTFHDPDLVPPHRYLATYLWLRHVFAAHAIIHFGKHGNLEWLPGKAVGLGESCFPQALIDDLPNICPFIVNDPGEGAQAKRRTAALILDHLTPAMTRAELYGGLVQLEALVDEYALAQDIDPKRARILAEEIASSADACRLDEDLDLRAVSMDECIRRVDAHLCDLKEMQIRDGLHVFGQQPLSSQTVELAISIARVPRFGDTSQAQSLHRAISRDLALDFDPLTRDLAAPYLGPRPDRLRKQSPAPWRTAGDTVERIEALAIQLVSGARPCPSDWHETLAVLDWIGGELLPALQCSAEREADSLLRALDGCAVPPGPSGAPTRGRPDVLPTGRNFYTVDPRAVPTPAAWRIGRASAEALVRRHWDDTGRWLRSVAFSAWGTANMRTGGDDVAQALALIGCQPRWEDMSGRVVGFEIIPLSELRRPRVDVTFRVSGMFRDAFPTQLDLIDSAVRAIAGLDEDDMQNPIAAAARREGSALRVFGSKPGAYGAGLQALIDTGGWKTRADFAESYLAWGSYAYGSGKAGEPVRAAFEQRLATIEAVLQAQDNREHDLLDSDDYYQFMGGLAATVETVSGRVPRIYLTDTSRAEAPLARKLEEEIARVVRGRATNPKWIAGIMRHGYKGAFEIAATLDYLFAFAATTDAVKDHHFDQVFDAYVKDDTVRDFIADANPDALSEIARRFLEAIRRGLWRPRSNEANAILHGIAAEPRIART